MKASFLSILLTIIAVTSADSGSIHGLVGSFEGEVVESSSSGRSFVVCLRVIEQGGVYSLSALMNDTNREPGMDHTSNTHWRWTGSGSVRGSMLAFMFSSPDAPPEQGSLQQTRKGVTLKLGTVRYRMKRAKEPCPSDE